MLLENANKASDKILELQGILMDTSNTTQNFSINQADKRDIWHPNINTSYLLALKTKYLFKFLEK